MTDRKSSRIHSSGSDAAHGLALMLPPEPLLSPLPDAQLSNVTTERRNIPDVSGEDPEQTGLTSSADEPTGQQSASVTEADEATRADEPASVWNNKAATVSQLLQTAKPGETVADGTSGQTKFDGRQSLLADNTFYITQEVDGSQAAKSDGIEPGWKIPGGPTVSIDGDNIEDLMDQMDWLQWGGQVWDIWTASEVTILTYKFAY